jgi:glycosyltransferase involved in cell wall biosynthesis
MRIAFYADARSPIAIQWVRWFAERHDDVHWISSREADPPLEGLASFRVISSFPSSPAGPKSRRIPRYALPLSAFFRHWVMPLRLNLPARRLGDALAEVQPDIVHAMRIPLEGMIAARVVRRLGAHAPRLALSIWGNDFTLHAPASPLMRWLTRDAVAHADGLHADCRRDIHAAQSWSLRPGVPTLVVPGNGGIQPEVFSAGEPDPFLKAHFLLPGDAVFVLNPRGLRGYARTDTFFRAIPIVADRNPSAHFLAVGMADSEEAEGWVRRLGIHRKVTLLPRMNPAQMAALFRIATITLSITTHDGTPNTLLEAMACQSFPICGNLESIREWVQDGVNGLLVAPGDPAALAEAILRACGDPALRQRAAERNQQVISERAVWKENMPAVEDFYRRIVEVARL